MTRMQIYLNTDQREKITRLATRKNVPKSVIIRGLLDKGLNEEYKTVSAKDAFLNMASHASTKKTPKELWRHIDSYLYGQD